MFEPHKGMRSEMCRAGNYSKMTLLCMLFAWRTIEGLWEEPKEATAVRVLASSQTIRLSV